MSWQRNINELRAYIASLESDLCDVDALLVSCRERMAKSTIMDRAIERQDKRAAEAVERHKNRLVQS
ncbi:hypothetical protein [Bradyrhizobium sp. Tv2a-2]|uniref:hypothetical protein n=1 Tax=Bradyrhizobium sp. Tv2a-2 TaxID=113395 RepID=UPI0003FC510A|nr:hypothetical protein [Bradyrhizobium sp. Tv2a-2]